MTDSEISEDIEHPTKPWTQKKELSKRVDQGMTIREITDEFQEKYPEDAPTWGTVRKYIDEHGLTTKHHRHKYPDDVVPLEMGTHQVVEYPVPKPVDERLGIEAKNTGRYYVKQDPDNPTQIVFEVEYLDHSDRIVATDRTYRQPTTLHKIGRMPVKLAKITGLIDIVEEETLPKGHPHADVADNSPIAQVTAINDNRYRLSTSPAPELWTPPTNVKPITQSVTELESITKPLQPIYRESAPDDMDEREIEDVRQYRLHFGVDYKDSYELEPQTPVSIHFGIQEVDGEPKMAIIINFQPDLPSDFPLPSEGGDSEEYYKAVRQHPNLWSLQAFEGSSKSEKTGKKYTTEDRTLYVPKAALNGLAFAITNERPKVDIFPHETYVALVPKTPEEKAEENGS